MDFAQLAEAKIRDWQRRVQAGEASIHDPPPGENESFHFILFKEVVALRLQAQATEDPAEKKALLQKARDRQVQLMAGLEQDRPKLARTLEQQLYELSLELAKAG